MLNSINIGTTGLTGFSKQLETISNNVANLNTPSFKASNTQFTDLFTNTPNGGSGNAQTGYGLATLPSVIDFAQGQVNQTGNDMDVAINGNGFFVVNDDTMNETLYTRDGRFSFNQDGILVNANGAHVQGLKDGRLADITLEGLRTSTASASTSITLTGALLTAETSKQIPDVTVTDSTGGKHTLTVEFVNNSIVTAGSWTVNISDGTTPVATGEVRFVNGRLDLAYNKVSFEYHPDGAAVMPLTLELDTTTTAAATGTSTLAVSKIDGYGEGSVVKTTFDTLGNLVISYSNGQNVKQQQLALVKPGTPADLIAISGNSFRNTRPAAATLGVAVAGQTTITADALEGSNVDLSAQFSSIIVTQRGYQASSQLISTANEMLDVLLHMKG